MFQKMSFKLRMVGVFLLIFCETSFPAGQMMHALLADRWIEAQGWEYFPEQRRAFIVGTLFPDIRYLGVLKREETHEKELTKQAIIAEKENPFEAGRKLHVWVDEIREQFVEEQEVYKMVPSPVYKQRASFLKIVEDALIWNELDVAFIVEALRVGDPGEEQFNVGTENLKKWHQILSHYIQTPPAHTLASLVTAKKGFFNISKDEIVEWNKLFSSFTSKPEIQEYVKNLLAYLDKKFQKE